MIISKKNYLKHYLVSLSMSNESTAYPLNNCYSDTLVEKTLYDSVVTITFTQDTPADTFIAINSNADSINVTAGGNTENLTTSYNNWFWTRSSDVGSDTSYTITLTGTGSLYLNYIYLGDRFKFDYLNIGSVPKRMREDIINTTVSKQVLKTAGVSHRETEIGISDYPQSDWATWDDWQAEAEAAQNQFFILYEEEPTKYPPYFATIEEYTTETERNDLIDFKFIAREAK